MSDPLSLSSAPDSVFRRSLRDAITHGSMQQIKAMVTPGMTSGRVNSEVVMAAAKSLRMDVLKAVLVGCAWRTHAAALKRLFECGDHQGLKFLAEGVDARALSSLAKTVASTDDVVTFAWLQKVTPLQHQGGALLLEAANQSRWLMYRHLIERLPEEASKKESYALLSALAGSPTAPRDLTLDLLGRSNSQSFRGQLLTRAATHGQAWLLAPLLNDWAGTDSDKCAALILAAIAQEKESVSILAPVVPIDVAKEGFDFQFQMARNNGGNPPDIREINQALDLVGECLTGQLRKQWARIWKSHPLPRTQAMDRMARAGTVADEPDMASTHRSRVRP